MNFTAETAPTIEATSPSAAPATVTTPRTGPGPLELLVGLPLRLIDLLLLVASIAVADACLYWEAGGTGYALAIILWTVLFWVTGSGARFRLNVVLLLLANLLLAVGVVWNFGFWNAWLPVAFLFALAVLTRGLHRHLLDALLVGIASVAAGILRLVGHVVFVGSSLNRRRTRVAQGALRYAIPGIVALVLFLFFGLIFTWANPVIDKWVGWFFEHLWEMIRQLLPDFDRLFVWSFVACLAAGLIRPLFPRAAILADEKQAPPGDASPVVDLAGLTTLFALVTAVGIFLLYNAIDAFYLWGKATLPEGVTYSEYARRGASWLTVALFISTLLIGVASAGFLRAYRGVLAIKGLSWAWILLDLVMTLGVLRRIHLYVGYNGLTPLRITGIFGTLMVATGLLVMAVKIAASRNLAWIVRRYVTVFFAVVCLYGIFPEQALCARFNTDRILRGNHAPLAWLFESRMVNDNCRISAEALPGLVPLLDHPDTIVANGMAGYLFDELERLENRMAGTGWRSYQVTVADARTALEHVRGRLRHDEAAVQQLRRSVSPYR